VQQFNFGRTDESALDNPCNDPVYFVIRHAAPNRVQAVRVQKFILSRPPNASALFLATPNDARNHKACESFGTFVGI
jgi:hypothetical protein